MAAGKNMNHQVLKQTLRIFSPRGADREGLPIRSTAADGELEEADVVWDCNLLVLHEPAVPRKPARNRPRAAAGKMSDQAASPASTSSVPVNVPDWSKILLHEYKSSAGYSNGATSYDDDWIDDDDDAAAAAAAERLLPHEMMMMRRRATSLSMVEGIGRTLKGRDMRRVRNSIWAQTGFQD